MDKKTLTLIGIGFGSLFGLILLIVIIVNLFAPKYKTYEQVEALLKDAAIEYYKNNSNLLPTENGQNITSSETTLTNAGLIKPLKDLLKNGEKCNANIVVTKTEADYDYKAYLDCGEDYRSIELYKVITEEQNVVTTGSGLYKVNNEYLFRGEAKNNYVTISEKQWRIVKIDSNNNVVLIGQFSTEAYPWDDRYNINYDEFIGINDFNISRVKDTLKRLYDGIEILNEEDKNYVMKKKWCVGKRPLTATKAENVECSVLSEESFHFGMLTPYEYLNISIDSNCQKFGDASCINYNFISYFGGEHWTMVALTENTRDIYTMGAGGLNKKAAESEKKLGLVIYLKNDVMYKDGDGTINNPYILK